MPRPKKRANLRDVAAAAGVSVATVSRVLNGAPSVHKNTRARVDAAIETLKFVPSAAARAINSGRTRIVGALVPTLDHAIFSRFLNALEHGLAAYDLSLIVATTNEDPDVEFARAQSLLNIGIEGLVISGISHAKDFEALVQKRDLPTIVTSYFDPAYHLPTIGYDNTEVGASAFRYLVDQGYSDILVLHGPQATNDRTRARLAGIRQSGRVSVRFAQTDLRFDAACKAFATALEENAPRAVLCLSDVIAQGVVFECQRRALAIPNDIAVMSIDDLPSSAHIVPALSTMHLPVRKMGTLAAKALAEWVEQGVRPEPQCLTSNLIVRQTT